eukprot:510460-Pelagomonas_calceolata.AAC.1
MKCMPGVDNSRQREHSPHQLRKRRHIGSKSRESPSPEGKREASVGLVGIWKHAAPAHQSYVGWSCFQWHVWLRLVCARIAHCARIALWQSGHGAFVQAWIG